MKHKATLSVLIASALTASYMGVNAMPGSGSYEAGDGASASGQNSVAVGHESKALKEGSVAIGAEATVGGLTNEGGTNSIAVGRQSKAVGDTAVAIGKGATSNILNGIAIGHDAGNNANDKPGSGTSAGSIFIGMQAGQNTTGNINAFIGSSAGSNTTGSNNIAFGNNAGTSVNGEHNISIGFNASNSLNGLNNISIGQSAGKFVKGTSNITIGSNANSFKKETTINYGVALGTESETLGDRTVALGAAAKSRSIGATAVGMAAESNNGFATALGYHAVADGGHSIAIGLNSHAVAAYSVAHGSWAESNGKFGTAVGYDAHADGERSVALGKTATAKANDSVALGTNTISDRNAEVIGYDPSETAVVKGADDALQLGADLQAQFDTKDAEYKVLQKEAEAIQTERNTLLEKQKELTAANNTTELETVKEQLADNKTRLDAKNKEVSDKEIEINKLVGTWKARKGAVSIGNSTTGETRQIINVAAGTEDTDAVNVAQLKAVSNGGFTVSTNSYDATDETTKASTKTTLIKTKIGGILPIEGKASTVYGSDAAPVANYSSDNLITYADAGTVRIGMLKSPSFTSVSIGDTNPITLANDNGKLTAGGSEVVTKNNITSIFNELYSFSDGLTTESKDGKTIVKLDKEALKNDAAFKGPKGDPGEKGADGKSALDVWKPIAGNENKTAEDFAKAIKGDKGETGAAGEKGATGAAGEKGADGKSALDVWKSIAGNENKTAEDFAKAIKGDKGETGAAGEKGADGKSALDVWKSIADNENKTAEDFAKAIKGEKGETGATGADGKSALDVWKSIAGNENKTAEDFAKAIKGDKGNPGTNGTNGTNGKSAYDLWKEQPGNEGKSEKDFVNYMKGASLPDFISIVDPKGNTTPGGTNTGTGSNPGGTNADAGSNPSAGSHGGANPHANATITISNGTDASNPAPTIAFKTDDKGNGTGTITGIKTPDGKDKTAAANVDYVTKVMEASVKSMDKALHTLSNTIGDVRDESRSGNAMNAALSALKPLDYKEHERTQVMAGVGHYEDKTGFALGVAHFTNERTMFNAGVALSGNKHMYNAGATFRFGSSSDEAETVPKTELEMLRAELEREKARNAEQEATIEMLKQLVLPRK